MQSKIFSNLSNHWGQRMISRCLWSRYRLATSLHIFIRSQFPGYWDFQESLALGLVKLFWKSNYGHNELFWKRCLKCLMLLISNPFFNYLPGVVFTASVWQWDVPLCLLLNITLMSCCLIIWSTGNSLWTVGDPPFRLLLSQASHAHHRSLSPITPSYTLSLLCTFPSRFLHGSFHVFLALSLLLQK